MTRMNVICASMVEVRSNEPSFFWFHSVVLTSLFSLDHPELIVCDHCGKGFHLRCHVPRLSEVPEGEFKCCECKALEMTGKPCTYIAFSLAFCDLCTILLAVLPVPSVNFSRTLCVRRMVRVVCFCLDYTSY